MLRKKFLATYLAGDNYKALALGKIPNWGWHLKDFKSECLVEVADVFNWNLVRTSTFALLPAWIALEAIREQLWIDYATVNAGGAINPEIAEYVKTPLLSSVHAEFARLAKIYRSTDEAVVKQLLEEIGIQFIEQGVTTSNGMAVGVEVVFESVVRESWTAFENLVRELWGALLDNDNGSIASRVAPSLMTARRKVISTANARTHPGSFQIETRQVVFQTFRDIKRFYGAAFGPTAISLFDTVEAGYIHVLYAFRNVLVHKRGKADATFREQIANYPEFNKIKDGDQIVLDGEHTRKMRDAAMVVGRKLVELADKELQRQAQQTT